MNVPIIESTGRIERVFQSTGLYSFDKLMGLPNKPGMPLRLTNELYGSSGIGKTTLAYYLAGKIRPTGRVVIVDWEDSVEGGHISNAFSNAGFEGTVEIASAVDAKGKPMAHEMMAQIVADRMRDEKDLNAAIYDSVGAFVPIVESNNDLGDANMGIRAKVMGQLSRRLINALRFAPSDRSVFFINHVHDVIGGRGHITPGGKAMEYLASNRILLYRREQFEHGATAIEAKCEKKRYGGVMKDERGLFVIIPGIGVSPEMTAVMDCVNLGLATRSTTVKIGDKSYGYISKIFQAAADKNDPELFKDFFDLLWSPEVSNEPDSD